MLVPNNEWIFSASFTQLSCDYIILAVWVHNHSQNTLRIWRAKVSGPINQHWHKNEKVKKKMCHLRRNCDKPLKQRSVFYSIVKIREEDHRARQKIRISFLAITKILEVMVLTKKVKGKAKGVIKLKVNTQGIRIVWIVFNVRLWRGKMWPLSIIITLSCRPFKRFFSYFKRKSSYRQIQSFLPLCILWWTITMFWLLWL